MKIVKLKRKMLITALLTLVLLVNVWQLFRGGWRNIFSDEASDALFAGGSAVPAGIADSASSAAWEAEVAVGGRGDQYSLNGTIIDPRHLRDPFKSMYEVKESASTVSVGAEESPPRDAEASSSSGFTYADLLGSDQQMREARSGSADVQQKTTRPAVQYPPFTLHGVVLLGEGQKVILAAPGQTYIVGQGNQVQDWQVEEIRNTGVRLTNQTGLRFILTLEGVTMDESSM